MGLEERLETEFQSPREFLDAYAEYSRRYDSNDHQSKCNREERRHLHFYGLCCEMHRSLVAESAIFKAWADYYGHVYKVYIGPTFSLAWMKLFLENTGCQFPLELL